VDGSNGWSVSAGGALARFNAMPARQRGHSPCGALAGSSAPHSSHVLWAGMIGWSVFSLYSDLNKPESNGQ